MRAELAIVILNYRTPLLVNDCLDSLRGEIRPGIKVIVVDNASGDGSADAIQDHITRQALGDWAQVIRSPDNGGYAAGNNLGIRSIVADAYVLLNSDTIVRPGAIEGLREALRQHPDAGMVGPSFEDGDGRTEQSCFRFPHPISEIIRAAVTGPITKVLKRYDVPLPFSEEPLEPDWLGFACVVIRKEVLDQVGHLDEGYFMYFEDIDYCQKVRAAGWKVLYWPTPRVVHFMGKSSNISSSDVTQRRASRYFYEARARYFATYFGLGGLWTANVLWTLGRTVSLAREAIEKKPRQVRDREFSDIWINAFQPFRPSTARPGPAAPPTPGSNPDGIGFRGLLREDFATHGGDFLSPGFWAVAAHRFGNWQRGVKEPALRAPLAAIHKTVVKCVDWVWGIDVAPDVKLGRRVRIWHHGGIVLGAHTIGDDVHIRHNTRLGDSGRDHANDRPIVQDRVRLGVGVSILGAVTVGHDTVVGPNAVVVSSCPPGSTLEGVPARRVEAKTPLGIRTDIRPV